MFDEEFGRLLNEGLSAIARRRNKTMIGVELEISLRLDEAGFKLKESTIARWRRGHIPKKPEQIALLAQYFVSRGSMPFYWIRKFLLQARYPHYETLLRTLFPAQNNNVPRQPSSSQEYKEWPQLFKLLCCKNI